MNFMKRFAVVLALLMLVSVVASAQTTSNLTGTVTLGGNPLPGATITISSPALQGVRTANSDVNGNYNFGAVPPGTYTIKFEMESMQPVTKNVQVTLSGTARADADMKLTAMAEAITVTATAPAVLETTEIQTNLQQNTINNLPTTRTLQSTVALAPGVATQSGTGGAAAGAIVIAGAPSYDSVFMVNGAAINENLRGQAHNLFIEDAIQETTVLTGGISAEYGRFTGGVVNAITKSGGNEFSGSIRDSLTNDKWTSLGDTANGAKNTTPQIDKLNSVYEATLGGRIIRDRLWFFGAGRYAKRTQGNTLADATATPYTFTDENTRYEAKLTGQITDKHSLVVSYLDIKNPQTNNCFTPCLEFSNLDVQRSLPNNFTTLHYNGILTNALLIEANYSKKYFAFKGSGGDFSDLAHGSYGIDGNTVQFFGAPVFCGFCDAEERNNKLYGAKATYYFSSKNAGTHNLVAGYEQWAEQRKANNYQSGSNYAVYIYNEAVATNCINGVCHPAIQGPSAADAGDGDLIKWSPILQLTQGTNFKTDSIYLNDKWDFNNHWNFNLGVRYDKNNGVDGSGNKVADDSAISPRLGLIYDITGNGRFRLNASYSKYVSRIAETIGSAGAAGGNPAYLYYEYEGPTINANHTLTTPDAFAQAFAWFNANGGLTRDPIRGAVPGLNTHILGSLKSPSVNEYTVGLGSQLTTNSFVRVDLVHKKWNNFYATEINQSTGQVPAILNDPAVGSVNVGSLDVGEVVNSDQFNRRYDALDLQLAIRPWSRTNIGANYTYSKLKGNVTEETSGSGPVTENALSYPEFKAFAANNPDGYLPGDQRHKLRAWIGYDIPTPFGNFNLSALQRFDSGTPYSAVVTNLNVRPFLPASVVAAYATPPSVTYYYSKRGAFRWDDVNSTDLAVNYELPITRVTFFAQAKLVNTFNNQAQINGNTTITKLAAFNPFTTTPVEGVNWRKGPTFGQARTPTTSAGANLLAPNGDYQLPRTYLFSVGARF
jgi:outer membrane receptor protein involved in Fe transport